MTLLLLKLQKTLKRIKMPKKTQREDLFCFRAVMARRHLPLRSKMLILRLLRLCQNSPLRKRIIL